MRIIILIYLCAFLHMYECQEDGDCYLDGVSSTDWQTAYENDYINDNYSGVFKHFTTRNIKDTPTTEGEHKRFFDVKLDGDALTISPSEDFKNFEKEVASQAGFKLTIRITFKCNNGNDKSLSFYQPITDLNTYPPQFDQNSYTYKLPMPLPIDFDLNAFGVNIRACDYDITNTQVMFEITPSENFAVSWNGTTDRTNKCHKLLIKTAKYLKLTSTSRYTLKVTDVGNPPLSSTTEFIIEVDEDVSVPPNPQFNEPYYTATYHSENEQHYITVNGPISLKGNCSKVALSVLGIPSYFNVKCNLNEVAIQLTSNLPKDTLKNEPVVVVTIQATLEAAEEPGKTVLIIYLPKQECLQTTTASPTECPPCTTASTESTPENSNETCSSSQSTTSTQMTSTECPLCPTITTSQDCTVTSSSLQTTAITQSVSTECVPCTTVSVESSTSKISSSMAKLFTRSRPPLDSVIKFNVYRFTATSSFKGRLGFVTALADPEEKITYALQTEEPSLEYNKDTGLLSKIARIDVGSHEFIAIATGTASKQVAKAKVIINVVNDEEEKASYSLLVQHVLENEAVSLNLSCQYEKCKYKIQAQYPSTSKELFVYDSINNLWKTTSIDREMDEFAEMMVPQVTLQLVLSDETVNYANMQDSSKNNLERVFKYEGSEYEGEERDWLFLPQKISNRPDQLLMTVIIEDVNDNKPTFAIQGTLTIGYPTSELARVISVPYLTKVVATDRDSGKNADIRYSTTSDYFVVHPKTGTIYPGVGALEKTSTLKFVVKATDRDGEEDGLSDFLNIEVKLLQENNIAVLAISDMVLEDVQYILSQLSNESDIKVNYLTATVTPFDKTPYSLVKYGYKAMNYLKQILKPKSVSEHQIVMTVYAFDDDHKLLETADIEKALTSTHSLENLKVEKWNSDWEEKRDVTAFIVAIGVLASLLVIFIIAVMLFYYFKVYKTSKENANNMITEDFEETNRFGSNKSKKTATRRPTGFVFNPAPIDDEESEVEYYSAKNNLHLQKNLDWYENDGNAEKPNGNIKLDNKSKLFRKKGEDDPHETAAKLSNSSNHMDDLQLNNNHEKHVHENDSPSNFNGEHRKSVSFKETVEKINIIIDDPDKQDISLDHHL